MKFLIPELSSHDDIFVFDTEQMLDRASPRKPFELILNKSLNELSEISKIIPDEGNTIVKIKLRDQNNELDFTLKNKRNIDRKMLNIIRNKEISAIIR